MKTQESAVDRSESQHWLTELRTEHRDLDEIVAYLVASGYPDSMRIQRLKRRKLRIKDLIARLESELIPDLDA